jgi:hypothetical protein
VRGVIIKVHGPPNILSGRYVAVFCSSHVPTSVMQAKTVQLVHLDCPSRSVVAPVTLLLVSTSTYKSWSLCPTMISEEASLSSRQYSLPHFLHCLMKSSLQLMQVWPQPKQSRRTPTICVNTRQPVSCHEVKHIPWRTSARFPGDVIR